MQSFSLSEGLHSWHSRFAKQGSCWILDTLLSCSKCPVLVPQKAKCVRFLVSVWTPKQRRAQVDVNKRWRQGENAGEVARITERGGIVWQSSGRFQADEGEGKERTNTKTYNKTQTEPQSGQKKELVGQLKWSPTVGRLATVAPPPTPPPPGKGCRTCSHKYRRNVDVICSKCTKLAR